MRHDRTCTGARGKPVVGVERVNHATPNLLSHHFGATINVHSALGKRGRALRVQQQVPSPHGLSFRWQVDGFVLWLAVLVGFQGLVDVVSWTVLAARVRSRFQVRSSVRVAQDWSRVVPTAWSMVSQAGGRLIR